jgi:hypothetical protein
MFAPKVTPFIALFVFTLLGWAEVAAASIFHTSTAFCHPVNGTVATTACQRALARLGSHLLPRETSQLDDEVEIPDEPEDDEPDDLGDGIEPGDPPLPCPAALDSSAFGITAPDSSRQACAQPACGPELPRFLRLCRFLC